MLQDRHVGVVQSWNALSLGGEGAFFHILIQKNRTAIKSLIRCTHFLARNHIAYTTYFDKSVDLVVACVGESLKTFLETIGTWVEKILLKRLRQAPYYSIMADECTSSTVLFYHG